MNTDEHGFDSTRRILNRRDAEAQSFLLRGERLRHVSDNAVFADEPSVSELQHVQNFVAVTRGKSNKPYGFAILNDKTWSSTDSSIVTRIQFQIGNTCHEIKFIHLRNLESKRLTHM